MRALPSPHPRSAYPVLMPLHQGRGSFQVCSAGGREALEVEAEDDV
jgi:hypothetical protein